MSLRPSDEQPSSENECDRMSSPSSEYGGRSVGNGKFANEVGLEADIDIDGSSCIIIVGSVVLTSPKCVVYTFTTEIIERIRFSVRMIN